MAKDTGELQEQYAAIAAASALLPPKDGSEQLTTGSGAGGVPGEISLPDFGGGQMDNALRAGWMAQVGINPYFPEGNVSNGNLSLGGAGPNQPQPTGSPDPGDTDFAGGIPDIITNPDGGGDPFAPPQVTATPVQPPVTTQPPGTEAPPGGNTRPDLPQPPGGPILPGDQTPQDTSWNWDHFVPKREGDSAWGGYDEDYQAFERYQPGMDSPWGMDNLQGGNKDFYQQQFVNLLRDEQGYQNRERQAQERRQDAFENPTVAPAMDWSWANSGEGLKDVTLGTGQTTPTSFTPNQAYAGMNNQEVWNQMKTLDAFNDRDAAGYMDNFLLKNPNMGERFSWSNKSDPTAAYGSINPASWEGMNHPTSVQNTLNSIMQNLYTPGQQGATAPVGYAAPV